MAANIAQEPSPPGSLQTTVLKSGNVLAQDQLMDIQGFPLLCTADGKPLNSNVAVSGAIVRFQGFNQKDITLQGPVKQEGSFCYQAAIFGEETFTAVTVSN